MRPTSDNLKEVTSNKRSFIIKLYKMSAVEGISSVSLFCYKLIQSKSEVLPYRYFERVSVGCRHLLQPCTSDRLKSFLKAVS